MKNEEIIQILEPFIRFAAVRSPTENIPAYCPFHKDGRESKPSFYVYIGKNGRGKQVGSAFCHTCGEGWSLKGLLNKLRVDRRIIDAVAKEMERYSPHRESPMASLDFSMPALPEAILGLFEYTPKALIGSGFCGELLKGHDVGFDRERKRITFAIRDHLGNLVGISGRTVANDYPRYKIYKSELNEVCSGYEFKKGCVLWGLDKFYSDLMHGTVDTPIVVCEGFKAALWVIQAGHRYTVALIGSHMSEEQKFLLCRVANEVVLFLDNDPAGQKAARKISKQLEGVEVLIANYGTPEPVSPDDLSKEDVQKAIETAFLPLHWRLSRDGN